jgi:hypothetical protein
VRVTIDLEALRRDLAPRTNAGWEGWFCIGIGDASCDVRWTKTHAFRSDVRAGMRPVAAVEGLEAPGEIVTWVATREGKVIESRTALDPPSVAHALDIRGPFPGARVRRGGDATMQLDVELRDRMEWASFSRILRYFGACGPALGSISMHRRTHDLSGVGIVEHAWGALAPFDPMRFVRGPWHWDVLAFDDGARSIAAALWVSLPGFPLRGVRANGRLPGVEATPRAVRVERNADVSRWRATIAAGDAELTYDATTTTEIARAAPGGGFVGFDFEGTLRDGRTTRAVRGRGFAEHGGPTR